MGWRSDKLRHTVVKRVIKCEAYFMICPNCGGAITMLRDKECPYCGDCVKEFNINVWFLDDATVII